MERVSGDEIFIMQSTFRENCDVSTQGASNASEFFGDIFWGDIDDHSFPEEVTYWDFSDQPDNSSEVPSTQQIVEMFGENKRFEPMVSDDYFADDEKVFVQKYIEFNVCSVVLS